MYPHRSQRECDVSQRIRAPQLSHSMSLIAPIIPGDGIVRRRLAVTTT
jgi:hypothetical protein